MDFNLTKNQVSILREIANYRKENSISPTIRYLTEKTNIMSTSTVHSNVLKLKDMGLVDSMVNTPRSLTLTKKGRSLLKEM